MRLRHLIAILSIFATAGCPGPAASTCSEAGASDCSETGTVDSSSDAADGSSPGTIGAPCTQDSECASGICLSPPIGRCTQSCTDRSGCPQGSNWRCQGVPSRGTICTCAPQAATEIACNQVDDECNAIIDDNSGQCHGACVDLWSDPMNCGTCDLSCAGGSTCIHGSCGCPPDRPAICGTVCVDTNTDALHCGDCATACPTAPNATPSCTGGRCGASCNAGFGDCNAMASDGCEMDVRANSANCGGCGRACSFAHAAATCSTGTCVMGACDPGYTNCDGTTLTGCEAQTASDISNCGSCGHACATTHATPACDAGACMLVSCVSGYGDCDAMASNGCEVNLAGDPRNCGSCGGICPGATAPNTIASCTAGVCGQTCSMGYGNCDGIATNGCETSLSTQAHCGSCTTACPAGQWCSGGVCSPCPAGQAFCGGSCIDVTSDSNNCGACGMACPSGTACVASVCSAVTSTAVTFPSMTSTIAGPSAGGGMHPLGTAYGTAAFQAGDAVFETFSVRTIPATRLDLDFQMTDTTAGCAVGQPLSWNVMLNGVVVGTYGFSAGSGINPRTIMQSYTFPTVSPLSGNQFTIRIESTVTVCTGGGAWYWVPGGMATLR